MAYGQQFGPLAAMMHVQQQGELGKQQGEKSYLARLYSQGMTAPESEQQGLAAKMGATSPEFASDYMAQRDSQADRRRKLVTERAVMLKALPSAARAQAWPSVRQSIIAADPELGAALDENYDPATFDPMIDQLAGGEASQNTVRSSFVGADGNMYSIMSDGSVKAQGIGADRKLQAFDVPGVGPQVVDLRNATARTVTQGGAQGQQQPASTFAFTQPPEAAGDPDAAAFAALPPDQQQVAAQMLQAKQDFTIQGGKVVPSGMSGGQPMNQPASNRLPSIMDVGGGDNRAPAWVRPASGGRGDAGAVNQLSAEEVQALGLPSGTVAQRGPDGKVTTIFTPDAGQRKSAREAKQKLPRVDAAMRRVDRLATAVETIAGGFADGGPLDQAYLKFTPDGQEVIQAAASLLPELTALTRVPGVGSQSDLETRLANLQLPSLEFPPEVNRRALAELRIFMQDLSEVYKSMAGGGEQEQAPAESNDDDALIGKYL